MLFIVIFVGTATNTRLSQRHFPRPGVIWANCMSFSSLFEPCSRFGQKRAVVSVIPHLFYGPLPDCCMTQCMRRPADVILSSTKLDTLTTFKH